jgi:BirA family transcriptional regulator, biotin operon repressor / biotin---[acetyl-CoA-carboxylase] ligase
MVGRWAHWWGVPLFEAFHSVPSTNDVLRARVLDGAPPFTLVTGETQTAGRGREGRGWHAPAGLGLWASVFIEVPGGAEALPVIPLRVGLALAGALEIAASGVRVAVKWPNDLMLEGRKAAGILCEVLSRPGRPSGVVVGVGVNLLHEPGDFPVELRRSAVSLVQVAGWAPDRSLLLGAFLSLLRDAQGRDPGSKLTPAEHAELEARDHLRGRRVRVDGAGEGVARGIDPTGALLLEGPGGEIRPILAGSVRILESTPEGDS